MAVRHDRLTRLDARGDDRFGGGRAVHHDVAELDGLIRLHDEDERPLLAGLHRRCRHHGGVLLRRELHRDVDELPRPEPAIGVGKRALDLDRAGRGVHGVVHERNPSGSRRGVVVGRAGQHAQRAARHVAFELGEARLGNRERDLHRHDLIDHDERRVVVGAHEVALVHHQRAGAAGDRRLDGGVFELHLGVLERGAIGGHGGVERRQATRATVSTCSRGAMPLVGQVLITAWPWPRRWPPAPRRARDWPGPVRAPPRAAAGRARRAAAPW